jgi:putative ABC transport system ATP-binding protein
MAIPELHYEQVHKFRFHRDRRGTVETTEVLRDISLRFEARDLAAVVGPSGCGKTTLFRLTCRLEEPNCGMIYFQGADIRSLDPRELRRRVGLVFQDHVLFGETVEDNVAYGLRVRGSSREEARALASACLERLGLDHSFLDRKKTTLTASQAARVVVARTLVLEPEVLLLDEPAARLDSPTAADLFAALKAIQGEMDTTILFSTTRLDDARRHARRILVLLEGKVVTDLPVEAFEAGAVPDKARRLLGLGEAGGGAP